MRIRKRKESLTDHMGRFDLGLKLNASFAMRLKRDFFYYKIKDGDVKEKSKGIKSSRKAEVI